MRNLSKVAFMKTDRGNKFSSPNPLVHAICALATILGASGVCQHASAQQDPAIISGGIGFLTTTNGGNTNYLPEAKPVAVLPLGDHLLIETRATVLSNFFHRTGDGYDHFTFKTMDYLQADLKAGSHATIVGGEFLTPFGTYNERLTQIWNQTFQDLPLIYGIGSMNTGSALGAMVRGNAFANEHASLSYAAYYSANSTSGYFGAERSSGGQAQLYIPGSGVEIGASYGRSLGAVHENFEGMHLWWQPVDTGFRFRSEFARAPHAKGYWFETDYRLEQFGGADTALGRLEPVFRMQQTFRDSPDNNDGLPFVNTKRADLGLDYHLPHEIRIHSSYGRQFSPGANVNIWETSLVYRLLIPTWKSKR